VEEEHLRRDATRSLIEVALLFGSAFGFFWVFHPTPTPVDRSTITVRFSEKFEKDLTSYLEAHSFDGVKKPPGGSGPIESKVRLDPELERQLFAYLERSTASEAGPSLGSVVLTSVLLLVAGVLVGWALWHRPSATPLAVALAITLAMIGAAPKLPRLGGVDFWNVVYSLRGIAALLLGVGVIQVFWPRKVNGLGHEVSKTGQDQESNGAENNKVTQAGLSLSGVQWLWRTLTKAHSKTTNKDSLLTLGFSLLVLTWTILLVAHRPEVYPPPFSDSNSKGISESLLDPAPKFDTGSWEPVDLSEIEQLKKKLPVKGTGKGDILLLIASADCTAIKGRDHSPRNNMELAEFRANRLREILQSAGFGEKGDLEIRTELLPQYGGCKGMKDLRAVFPFLITLTNTKR